MSRLLIVSNRLPITVTKDEEGLVYESSVGGLATGLDSFYKRYESLWIGWPGLPSEEIEAGQRREIAETLAGEDNQPVFLTQQDLDEYYYGFCNKTVWPLFHYFTQYAEYDETLWAAYQRANQKFFDAVVKVAKAGDTIWVHDYQLMLLPRLLRQRLKDASIGFFLHIPFPSFEVFRLLPWRNELLEGLLGADLIGFHTFEYVRHFVSNVRRLLGLDYSLGQITVDNRVVEADTFPMGIDAARFEKAGSRRAVKKALREIRQTVGDRTVIFSVDRLDYTKGIAERLEAFDLFLEENPDYKERVTLILVAVPSRTEVEHYALLKKHLDELVGRINGAHGTIGWVPVWYLYHAVDFDYLAALYLAADVALVTPIRDGMNLIAKEFIAANADGNAVLVLSEMAGASAELGEAIIVNPNDKRATAAALKQALEMPLDERVERNAAMQERLRRYNVVRWAQDFMDNLAEVKSLQQVLASRQLTAAARKKLIGEYAKSNKRLFLLDYDGTLRPFVTRPERARPDLEVLKLIQSLAADPRNEVVLISGRDKDTLEKWFGDLDIGLTGEHGVWIRERGGQWKLIQPISNAWKDQIRPTLALFVDRTPGSFLEEKDFSLVWHYRAVDPELASLRARELMDTMLNLVANLDLAVLEGSKVTEIKNAGINKGRAALHWLGKGRWDFILAAGDDWTDEDTFAVLPEFAHSIKVGIRPSQAEYSVEDVDDVRALLAELAT